MNAGIRDADNLSWKLAAVLQQVQIQLSSIPTRVNADPTRRP